MLGACKTDNLIGVGAIAVASLVVASGCSPSASADDPDSPRRSGPVETMAEYLPAGTEVQLHGVAGVVDEYVGCIGGPLDGFIQLDLDRFAGVRETYSMPDGSDNEAAILSAVETCDQRTGFQSAMDAAYSHTFLDRAVGVQMTANFTNCIVDLGFSLDDAPKADPADVSTARSAIADTVRQIAASTSDQLGAVIDCEGVAVYGPKIEF